MEGRRNEAPLLLFLESPLFFESVELGSELREESGRGRQVLLDARDVRVRRVVGDLVVDVDLVDDRSAEFGLILRNQQDAGRVACGLCA